MKRLLWIIAGAILTLTIIAAGYAHAANPVTFPINGGTGTSTKPVYGQVLLGNNQGLYDLVATSSLGISVTPAGASSSVQYNANGSFGGDNVFTYTGTQVRVPTGTVGAAGLGVGSNVGIYLAAAGTLGLTNGTSGLSWDGSSFYPNTTSLRDLGKTINLWNHLFTNFASTTALTIGGITGSTQCLQADTNGNISGTGSACGSGGGSGTISTSTPLLSGQGVYATGVNTIGSVATSTPSLGLGLSYSGTLGNFFAGTSGTLTIASSSLFTGTTGQNAYFNGTNSITGTSTIFTSTASRVGIGTTTPNATLTVNANQPGFEDVFRLYNQQSSSGGLWDFWIGAGTAFASGYFNICQGPCTASNYELQFQGFGVAQARGAFSAPAFDSSITGRGSSPILQWTNTGGSFNGTLDVGEQYVAGNINLNNWIGGTGSWNIKRSDGSALALATLLNSNNNLGIGTSTPGTFLSAGSSTNAINLDVYATSTLTHSLVVGGKDRNPLLQIGSTTPPYGYLVNDRINSNDNRNDYSVINAYNFSAGNCATADFSAANDLAANAAFFADLGHTSSGFTGSGCANNPFTGFGANSTYLFDPSGNINFAVGSTSSNTSFRWFTGGYDVSNEKMRLTNAGNLGLGTTSPYAQLSLGGGNLVIGAATTGGTPGDLFLPKLGVAAGTFLAVDATGKVIATTTPSGSSGITSLNGLTASSQTFATSSSNGGWGFSSVTSTHTLNIPTASATNVLGLLSSTDWSTFNNKVSATRAINTTYPLQGGGDLSADRTLTLAFGTTTSNTWAGTQTFTNTPVLATLTGVIYGNSGALAAKATSTATLGLGLSGTLTTLGNPDTLSIATSSLFTGTTGQFPYFSGTNTITATSSLFLATSGNIGVGTTSPYGLLSINAPAGTAPYLVIGSSTNEVFKITPSAAATLGVGTTTPWRTLSVTGTVGFDGLTTSASTQSGVLCLSSNKEVINDSVACIASAARYKENIQDLGPGLNELMKLRPVSFTWKKDYLGGNADDPNQNGVQYSLIADEVQKIDPHLISLTTQETTFEGKVYPAGSVNGLADMNHWVALIVKSIQQVVNHQSAQDKQIKELQAQVKALQAQIEK